MLRHTRACGVRRVCRDRDGHDPYLDPLLAPIAEEAPVHEFDDDALPIKLPPPVSAARVLQ